MGDAFAFLHAMAGERPVEIAAFLFGLANITLIVRRSIWNYPFGIAMVSAYAWIFYGEKFYSGAILQLFFLAVQAYGWAHWLTRRDAQGRVIVARLSRRAAFLCVVAGVAGAAALGAFMKTYTDASHPYWDAGVAAFSVIAQVLLARRFLENWLFWVAVDALAIGLYLTKGLYPTAVLYMLFFIIASIGYLAWRRAWRSGEAAEG